MLHKTPGSSGGASSGEAAVRAALKDYSERLPAPFVMVEIEGRIKEKSPYVVVALQEVRSQCWGWG
jgi:dynein heavy chain